MRDDFQFAALAAIAVALVICETVLAMTNNTPVELHAALIFVLGVLGGTAVPKSGGK